MEKLQKKIVLVFLLAILLFAVGWACYPSLVGLWADRLYAQANQVDDSEVPRLVNRLAMLGTPAIPRLAAALGSERKAVAHAARACFLEMIESWEHPDTRPHPKMRLAVAFSLAGRMKYYGPDSRRHAVTLARHMLQVSNDGLSKREASQFLLACESILDAPRSDAEETRLTDGEAPASLPSEPIASTGEENAFFSPGSASATKKTGANQTGEKTPLSERSLLELARLPGGGLPPALPELGSRRLTPEEGGGREATPRSRALTSGPLLTEAPKLRGSSDKLSPEGVNADTPGSDPASTKDAPLNRLPQNPTLRPLASAKEGATAETSPRYGSNSSHDQGSNRVYSLIMQLRSDDPRQADRVRRELSAGGFKTIHFALAERLTDPDPLIRKELAQVLPRLKSIRAESWLKWLLRDDDPNVRREALTTLASSKDPMLLSEIAHIAQSDTDPKIRLEGQRIERRLAQ